MSESALRSYLGKLEQEYHKGDATEHSYRPAFKELIDTLGHAQHISATNEPKRGAHGAPDYRVVREQGQNRFTIGYVEAKDIGKALDEEEKSDQLKRYRGNLHNLILTDYLEFRWYLNGEHRKTVRLARLGASGRFTLERDGLHDVEQLLQAFLGTSAEPISQPKELAERMARLTRMVRDTVVQAFAAHQAPAALRDLHQAFEDVLIPDLSVPDFADMFAQTLAYGLFAACYNHRGPNPFRRQDANSEIPKTNPFLRKLFNTISGSDLDDESFMRFVDDLAQLLTQADMPAILRGFGKSTRQEDPVVHFYETFLSAYDPKLRELRGVYYTPEPVVSYIVRSVDSLLKTHFNCSNGLAERRSADKPDVLLLDPACGTGTFSYMVIDLIRERFRQQHQAGMWSAYVREHLLPRLFSFELLMAPYAVAHLKLGMQLAGLDLPEAERANWTYDFQSDERLGIYLTNTLEEAARRSQMLLAGYLSDEANEAARVKKEYPVMVVLGNPPYSGHSANKGDWIMNLLRGRERLQGEGDTYTFKLTHNYFEVDGQPLGERNPKWLNDDYVKFIRFAQWRIEQTGYGILAFITNHGYLDNPTFRGMRQSLMQTFDEMYLLDLHGNSKKKERAPDGGKDENVFDIQQGVAIGIFIKRHRSDGEAGRTAGILTGRGGEGSDGPTPAGWETGGTRPTPARQLATVRHAHLWGERASKYTWLTEQEQGIASTEWKTLSPQAPFYLFVPQDGDLRAEYEGGWKVTEAMPVNVLGFQTHRDHFAIDFDEAKLRQRISEMRDKHLSDQEYAEKYGLTDNRDWQLSKARQALRSDPAWQSALIRCLYRPFDWRFCYFSEVAMDYPRTELRQHMLQSNLSLNVTRQTKADQWRNAIVANTPTPALYTEIKDGSNAFPLYLYPDATKADLWSEDQPTTAPGGRRPNLSAAFIKDFAAKLGMTWIEDGKGNFRNASLPTPAGQEIGGALPRPAEGAGRTAGFPTGRGGANAVPEEPLVTVRSRGYLPHWEQRGATYFVTFRLADSLPKVLLEAYQAEREAALIRARQSGAKLTDEELRRLDWLLSERVQQYLDTGAGRCSLGQPAIAEKVASALRHFNGIRYQLFAWCIMPNHVHVVFQPLGDNKLEDILHSWKLFTSREANRLLGTQGAFWEHEYYDHLIRDEADFQRIMEYVMNNPPKAGLEDWQWVEMYDWPAEAPGEVIPAPAGWETGGTPRPTFGPEDVFAYMYAVFHSPSYRERYAEFLKIDFPRLPLTSNADLFRALCTLGDELVRLHLLEGEIPFITSYPVPGNNRVENVRYTDPIPGSAQGRVYINATQYFDGVPPEVWAFHIGGYQVCQKWLKDRKGRTLSLDEMEQYQKIVAALSATIRLMDEIDTAIEEYGGWPIE